jgi:hypothetical protein
VARRPGRSVGHWTNLPRLLCSAHAGGAQIGGRRARPAKIITVWTAQGGAAPGPRRGRGPRENRKTLDTRALPERTLAALPGSHSRA